MRFFLFLLANVMLFIRPVELFAELGDLEPYRYFLVACLIASLPVVLRELSVRYPGVPPVAGCVLLLLPAVGLSHISHGAADLAYEHGFEFFKVTVYFILMLTLIDSVARLRQFLLCTCLLTAGLAGISMLRYQTELESQVATTTRIIEKDGKKIVIHPPFVIDKYYDPTVGHDIDVKRMCGTGVFNDPNDVGLAFVTGVPLGLYWLTDRRHRAVRPLWIGVLLLFGTALMLTNSRGGFLALIITIGVFCQMRFGGKKSLILAVLMVLALGGVFAGRMTSISTNEGTGQARVQLWSDALTFFQEAPLFGIGMENYRVLSPHVAHNAFLHCYAELGIVGGSLFVGAFYLALFGLYQLRGKPGDVVPADDSRDPELARLHPYIIAMVAGYALGIMFLSRTYVVPTYLVLGVAVVTMRLHTTQVPIPIPLLNRRWLPHVAAASVGFLAVSYTFVRMFVSWK